VAAVTHQRFDEARPDSSLLEVREDFFSFCPAGRHYETVVEWIGFEAGAEQQASYQRKGFAGAGARRIRFRRSRLARIDATLCKHTPQFGKRQRLVDNTRQ